MAAVASIIGGVAGYGTGALMPLVLVPILGPEPVVPIIAISGVFNNTWRMLAETRFKPHFSFVGDFATHYGIFPGCGTSIPFAATSAPAKSGGCC